MIVVLVEKLGIGVVTGDWDAKFITLGIKQFQVTARSGVWL